MTRNIRRLLILFTGASMPYCFVTVNGIIRSWSLGTLFLIMYIISMLPNASIMKQIKNKYGNSVFLPVYFFTLLVFINTMHSSSLIYVPNVNLTLLLCVIAYLSFLIHNILDNKALDMCVLGFSLATLSQPILFAFGIGVSFDGDLRMTIFDQNTNFVGIEITLAIAFLVGDYIMRDGLGLKNLRYVLILFILPAIPFLVAAASRSSFLALFSIAVLAILYNNSQTKLYKFIFLIFGSVALYVAVDVFLESGSYLAERLLNTSSSGDLSERDDLWTSLVPKIWDHPFLGVGQTGYVDVASKTIGMTQTSSGEVIPRSPHNVLIEIVLYTGVVGLIMMLTFWKTLLTSAWTIHKHYSYNTALYTLPPLVLAVISQQMLIHEWPYLLYAFVFSKLYNYKQQK